MIEASAGTGKTYTIEHLVLELIFRGHKLGDILLVTFTEKATNELKGRIRAKLIELIQLEEGAGADLDPEHTWLLTPENRQRLRDALFEFENASIYTIHGFCNSVLREFAFENRRLFRMEQQPSARIFDLVFPQFLKTYVLTERCAYRDLFTAYLKEHPRALEDSDLGGSLLQTLKQLVPKEGLLLPDLSGAEQAWQQWCRYVDPAKALEELADIKLHANFRKKFETYLTDLAALTAEKTTPLWEVLHLCATWQESGKRNKSCLINMFDATTWTFTKAKKGMVNDPSGLSRAWQELQHYGQALIPFFCSVKVQLLRLLLPDLRRAMRDEKQQRGWFDFDDMIGFVADQIGAEPAAGGPLTQALRKKYRIAIIDEFQDTDERQWTLFSRIFLASRDHRLYLIGDPKQAIYRFRGADIHTYLAARRLIGEGGGGRLSLSHNYRSTADMIAATNHIFTHPSLFAGDIQYRDPVRCGRPDRVVRLGAGPAVRCLYLQADPDEEKPKLSSYDLKQGFAHWMAETTRDLLAAEPTLKPRDIAVLTRKRREGEQIGEVLAGHGIPFAFYKQGGLFQTREAAHMRDMLAAIEQVDDDSAVKKALLSDFYQVSPTALGNAPTIPDSVRVQLIEWRKQIYSDRDYRRLFHQLFGETGILERLLQQSDDERAVTNYEHLADLLTREGAALDLQQLLSRLGRLIDKKEAVDDDLLRLETEKEAVQIMTIHSSKGLEFEVVFLFAGFSAPRQEEVHAFHDPQRGRILDLAKNHAVPHQQELDEEAERLYYVALTRAKSKMYLPYWRDAGRAEYNILLPALDALFEAGPLPYLDFETRRLQRGLGSGEARVLHQAPAPPDIAPTPDYPAVLAAHNQLRLTSYTKLAHHKNTPLAGLVSDQLSKVLRDDEDHTGEVGVENEGMPKGKNTGNCIHEILEHMDPLQKVFGEFPDFEQWAQQDKVKATLLGRLQNYDLERHYAAAAAMCYHALTQPLREDWRVMDFDADDRRHEVDFYFPVKPEGGQRVILNGSIDLVLRRDDRYYFADWKSDTLSDYSEAALKEHVEAHYAMQVRIYLMAMRRWLGIRQREHYDRVFAGFFYLFVRGMDTPGHGVYFYRPSWEEVRAFEQHLKQHDYA
nr:UvrD-helicase domain-containing protein [Acanthopleuribacter pedis]